MKEAKLAVRDGEGEISRHVTVKLTGDHLILKEIPNSRQLPINSTSIGSSQKGNSLPPVCIIYLNLYDILIIYLIT